MPPNLHLLKRAVCSASSARCSWTKPEQEATRIHGVDADQAADTCLQVCITRITFLYIYTGTLSPGRQVCGEPGEVLLVLDVLAGSSVRDSHS